MIESINIHKMTEINEFYFKVVLKYRNLIYGKPSVIRDIIPVSIGFSLYIKCIVTKVRKCSYSESAICQKDEYATYLYRHLEKHQRFRCGVGRRPS